MKNHLKQVIKTALLTLQQQKLLPDDAVNIQIDRTRDPQHGDFSANIAMMLAKTLQRKPREVAELIMAHLPASPWIKEVAIAGPGFINFFLTSAAFQTVVQDIFKAGDAFGTSKVGAQAKIHLEFVSSNPNGPLHVGHGRGAAYGATLADILTAAGFAVHREYYVNDAGRQMDIVTTSVWLRYLALCGETVSFPKNGYQGQYVIEIAQALQQQHGIRLQHPVAAVFKDVPADESAVGGDKEAHIDGLIAQAKALLGDVDYQQIFKLTITTILDDMRSDLAAFSVTFQEWFSEKSLFSTETITRAIDRLRDGGHLYQQDGATWFRSTTFGDDKDRVVIRENGQPTYFTSDVAYFLSKHERGFERMIIVLGADHHGYIPRLKAAMQALGLDPNYLTIPIVQLAVLYRGKERIPMSTRGGAFVTLRQLREEVGNDAARFFYVWRKCEQGLDFDLELAKSKSNENPVYYIQYAHARICSVFRQLAEKDLSWNQSSGLNHLSRLESSHEKQLLIALGQYPEIIEAAALNYEPHLLAHYLRDLANCFHGYYNACQFIVTDNELRDARLCLITATQQVLKNGLNLLSVSAPETM